MSESDEWGTPQRLVWRAARLIPGNGFDFSVDVCATEANAKAKRFFTKEQNALAIEWPVEGPLWMNPPYSESGKWVKKACGETRCGCVIIALLKCDPSTEWWSCVHDCASNIWWLPRIKHVGAPHVANFAQCLALYQSWHRGCGRPHGTVYDHLDLTLEERGLAR